MASSVFTGVIWSSVQRFGTMIISFVANMILARLLTPDDFGTVGMLLFFLAIANTFVDSGFGSALIQKNEPTEKDKSTVFYINLIMSLILYCILFFTAPLISKFYNISILCILLRVEGLVLILNAFGLIQTTLLKKELNFKALSNCNLLGNIIGAIIGIIAAYYGMGVWSLVIRLLITSLFTTVLLWISGKWTPHASFCMRSFKDLFGFGGFMLLSSALFTITNNLQTLIIGKAYKPSTLGNYTQANTLKNYMSDSFSSVVGQVVFPDFSNHQDNNEMMRQRVNMGVSVLSFVTGAIMAICILIGEPLIQLLYGSQWLYAIPLFKILCVGGVALSVQDINYHLVAAKGKSKILFLINSAKVVLFLFMLFISSRYFDVEGVLWAIVIYNFIAYFAFAAVASHYISTSITSQLKIFAKNAVVVSIPCVILLYVGNYIQFNNHVISILFYTIIYIVLLLAFSKLFRINVPNYLAKNILRIIQR